MKTYEYKRVSATTDCYGPHIDWLNGEGAKGWRLVAQDYVPGIYQPGSDGVHRMYDNLGEWTGLFVREVTLDDLHEDWPGTAEVAEVTT